jgi:hypothetical protein
MTNRQIVAASSDTDVGYERVDGKKSENGMKKTTLIWLIFAGVCSSILMLSLIIISAMTLKRMPVAPILTSNDDEPKRDDPFMKATGIDPLTLKYL